MINGLFVEETTTSLHLHFFQSYLYTHVASLLYLGEIFLSSMFVEQAVKEKLVGCKIRVPRTLQGHVE